MTPLTPQELRGLAYYAGRIKHDTGLSEATKRDAVALADRAIDEALALERAEAAAFTTFQTQPED